MHDKIDSAARPRRRAIWTILALAGAALFLAGCAPTLAVSISPGTVARRGTTTVTVKLSAPYLNKIPAGTVTIDSPDPGLMKACTVTPASPGGTASCVISFAAAGTKTIKARYDPAPDAGFTAATGETTLVVSRDASVTVFTNSPAGPFTNPLSFAVQVAMQRTCQLDPDAGASPCPPPTGSVAISGGGQSCTTTLQSVSQGGITRGAGSCELTFSTSGTFNVTATYGGDAFYASSSATLQVWDKAPSLTVLDWISEPTLAGTTATADVYVDTSALCSAFEDPMAPPRSASRSYCNGPINGTVTVSGAGAPCTVDISSAYTGPDKYRITDGHARCQLSFAAPGTYSLTATYSGSDAYDGSSTTLTVTLQGQPTKLTLSSPSAKPYPGQKLTLNLTATGNNTAPTGSVTVTGPDNAACTATLVPDPPQSGFAPTSQGTCTVSLNSIGRQSLTASYPGDATHVAASATLGLEVAKLSPIVSFIWVVSEPSAAGEPVQANIGLRLSDSRAPQPTGAITLTGGGAVCPEAQPHVFVCSSGFSLGGKFTLTASYPGDTVWNAASATYQHTVLAPPVVCYTLTLTTIGRGQAFASPGNCADGSGRYTAGTVVTLTAVPDAGQSFNNWSGAAGGTDLTTTVTMDADKAVTAAFTNSSAPTPCGPGTGHECPP